jgi:hypothetical protein
MARAAASLRVFPRGESWLSPQRLRVPREALDSPPRRFRIEAQLTIQKHGIRDAIKLYFALMTDKQST